MQHMTGGEAAVRSLIAHGVDTVFGLPGVQMDGFFNALYDERNRIRVIHTRHEQGVGYMAYGYAAATGRVGTCAVVPGPGLLNTTAALATAYACNAPVLCVAGQVPTEGIGRGFGLLHEIPDQLGVIRGLTKWADRAWHPTGIPVCIGQAFERLPEGRIRPVGVELPMDVLAARAAVELPEVEPADRPLARGPDPDPEAVEAGARLLGRARRPLIFVGGGIWGAEESLRQVAEMLQAPVVMSRNALGALSDRHPLAQKLTAGHRLWKEADVVLAVGTRLHPMAPQWGMTGLELVRIDIDPVEMTRAVKPDVQVLASATTGLAALAGRLPAHNRARDDRTEELEALKRAVEGELRERLAPQMAILDALRSALPEDGIFVEELTQPGYVGRLGFPVWKPRTYIGSGYQGTLGFGYATALGVQVGCPDRPVLSISGDGGFMYTAQELSTAVQQGLPVVAVVFADGAYGNVKRMQIEDYGGKVIASDLRNPDFVRYAESFGAEGRRADTPEALRRTIEESFRTPGPTLIEYPLGPTPAPWPYLALPRVR